MSETGVRLSNKRFHIIFFNMKAQRNLLNDYIDDVDYDDYDDEDYNDNGDEDDDTPFDDSNARYQPKRSVTLGDFFSPGLLERGEDDECDDPGNEDVNDSDYYDEEDGDGEMIEKCFQELEKKYDLSKCDEEELVNGLRECDYNLKEFVERALEGEYGPFKKLKSNNKSKTTKQPNVKVNNNNKSQQQKGDLSRLPPRTVSHFCLAKPPKQHETCKRTPESVTAALATRKKRINIVIVGHVDAGKSTLMGHLLYLTGNVSHSEFSKISKESNAIGKGEDMFAWVLAEDEVERNRGVTIDVAMTEFETKNLSVTILDAPGHKDFVPNMIAGASQADAALLVIDASNPNIEKGQAKEHLLLCRSLGVSSLIVVVNKMDYVSFDESAFKDVEERLSRFLKSIGWKAINFIPTSASIGCNLIKKATNELPWYNGPTILEAIDNLSNNLPQYDLSAPFVLCVSESIDNTNSLSVFGKIESGYVCVGDNVRAYPIDAIIKVAKVKINGNNVPFASSGTIVELVLQTQLLSDNIGIGSALTSPENNIPISKSFKARIVTFHMNIPLLRGANLIFHRHSVDLPLKIDYIVCTVNKKTKSPEKKNPGFVQSNSMADVLFTVSQPIPVDTQENSKSFSRFIIRAGGETLGFGSITKVKTNPY